MIWNDVKNGHQFKDGSVVTQRHQTHLYDCYRLAYESDDGDIHTLIQSKDHLIKINLKHLPPDIQSFIRENCNGVIPLKENITCNVLGTLPRSDELLVKQYVYGEVDASVFDSIEEVDSDTYEVYLIKFKSGLYREVFVTRTPIETESQKINDDEYWIPVEGIHYLYTHYGTLNC